MPEDLATHAQQYAQFRAPYARNFFKRVEKSSLLEYSRCVCVDIGAGTGLWTSQLIESNLRRIIAIEPDEKMRMHGASRVRSNNLMWCASCAENLPFSDQSIEIMTLAAVLQLLDFDLFIKEVNRVLVKNGMMVVLWNPRCEQEHPLLIEAYDFLNKMMPEFRTMFISRKQNANDRLEQLRGTGLFSDIKVLEEKHLVQMTPLQFVGQWYTTPHFQLKLGKKLFKAFIDHMTQRCQDLEKIEVPYLTKAWIAYKK